MTQLTLELPEDLVRQLESIARATCRSVEEVALERLEFHGEPSLGSPESLREAMHRGPKLLDADLEELESSIRFGQIAVKPQGVFEH